MKVKKTILILLLVGAEFGWTAEIPFPNPKHEGLMNLGLEIGNNGAGLTTIQDKVDSPFELNFFSQNFNNATTNTN